MFKLLLPGLRLQPKSSLKRLRLSLPKKSLWLRRGQVTFGLLDTTPGTDAGSGCVVAGLCVPTLAPSGWPVIGRTGVMAMSGSVADGASFFQNSLALCSAFRSLSELIWKRA